MMKLETFAAEIDGYFTHISPSLDETLMNYDGFHWIPNFLSTPNRLSGWPW